MTREEVIEYWEQFNAEIDDLYDACSDADRDVFVKQREIVEYTISALRKQEPNDWICTLKCTALMDEGMCSHGGLCCLCESQRSIKEKQPLTLDELQKMSGEPVFVVTDRLKEWCIVHSHNSDDVIGGGIIMTRRTAEKRTYQYACYGKTWLAYRQKKEV